MLLFIGGVVNVFVFLGGISVVIGWLGYCGVVVKVGFIFLDVLWVGLLVGWYWLVWNGVLVWLVLFFVYVMVDGLWMLFLCRFFFGLFV